MLTKARLILSKIQQNSKCEIVHSKKCWVVLTQFWEKYGQTQPLG